MNRKKLLFVPKVYVDESLVSYIYRLAIVNNYEVAWIYEMLGLNVNKIRTQGFQLGNEKINTSILAEITGIDQIVFDSLSLSIKNSDSVIQNTIDQFAIRNVKKQFCPLCIKENIYYRKIWDINIYTRCHIHNCLLMCRCIDCNRHLTNQDILNGLCKCGFVISNTSITSCNKADLGLIISEKIDESGNIKRIKSTMSIGFEKLGIDLIVYLIIFLSIKISHGFYERRIKFTESSDVQFNDKIVNEAFSIFTDWPRSFYDFLNDFKMIPKTSQLLTGLKKDFGRFHFELIKLSKIGDYSFFTDEYKNYLQNIWDGGSGQKIVDVNLRKKYISAYQAIRFMGTKSINFSTLITEGIIEGKIVLRQSKNLILIDKSSLENYKKQRDLSLKSNRNQIEEEIAKKQGFITVREAALKLETSNTTIIKIAIDHSVKKGHRVFILKSFVDNLYELINYKSEIFNGESELIEFYHAQRYFIKTTDKTKKDYYNFLFETEIQSYIKPKKIGLERLYLNKQQLIQSLRSYKSN